MSGRPIRVLIVDDDADTRYLLRRAFAKDGRLEVVGEAEDGSVAAEATRQHRPDLVLLDLHMPRVDGLTALPLVRAAATADLRIVLMSVHPLPGAVASAGAPFLQKRPGLDRFVDHLLEVLSPPPPEDGEEAAKATWHLPADRRSGAVARAHLRDLLQRWGLGVLLDEVELLATELVNNAVLHARSEVTLAVRRGAAELRVAVSDSGHGTPHDPHAGLEATHGRGLMLVESLSQDWGIAVNGEHKTLWFELALPV